jgi:hypothetical protein
VVPNVSVSFRHLVSGTTFRDDFFGGLMVAEEGEDGGRWRDRLFQNLKLENNLSTRRRGRRRGSCSSVIP